MTRKRRRDRGGSGGISRRTALALIAGGGLLGVSVSGAFDSVRGDRPFDVGVASDQNARLVIDTREPSGSNGAVVTLLELENQASGSFTDLDVSVLSSGSLDLDVEEPLDSGETFDPGDEPLAIDAMVSCTDDVTESVDVELVVSGPGERVEATRSITVTCRAEDRGPIQVPACNLSPTGGEESINLRGNDSTDDITGEYDVYVSGGATVDGSIDVTGQVTLTNGARVTDSITAGGSIDMNGGVKVGGSLVTGGSLVMTNGAEIEVNAGRIEVCGDFEIGGGPDVVVSDILVGGDLTNVGSPGVGRHISTTDGSVSVGEDIDISGGSKITSREDIVVVGELQWDGNQLVTDTGDLDVGGDLAVSQGGVVEIAGDISVDGTLDMAGNRLESKTGGVTAEESIAAIGGRLIVSDADAIDTGGDLTITGGSVETTGDVHVGGDLDIEAGVMTETGDKIVIAGDLVMGQGNGWPRIEPDVILGGNLYKDRGVINGEVTYDD
ncbi:MAG: hypothetical protein ACOCQ3_00455 [Natronomonas sp.]